MYFWFDLQCVMWYHNQLVNEMLQGLALNLLAVIKTLMCFWFPISRT